MAEILVSSIDHSKAMLLRVIFGIIGSENNLKLLYSILDSTVNEAFVNINPLKGILIRYKRSEMINKASYAYSIQDQIFAHSIQL